MRSLRDTLRGRTWRLTWAQLMAAGCVFVCGSGLGLLVKSAAAAPPAAYPPLRFAGDGTGRGVTPTAGAAGLEAGAPAGRPGASTAGASTALASAKPIVPDATWCGIESPRAADSAPLPCKYPGLPCGPVSADQISHGAGESTEDLDGDGQADLTLAGRRDVPKTEIYAAIYRATDAGHVLVDYHAVPPRAEPTMASVVLAAPGSPPLLRDGYDMVESASRTVSIARLRRFDGQRFRTLLTFCAHRAEPAPGAPLGVREGHNRVEIVDIDKDGQKEVVIHGLIRPTVYRFAESGLGLIEDPNLGQIYRDTSPEGQRVKALRAEATRLLESGQVRRAAETLLRAQSATTYDIVLTLDLCGLLLRSGQAEKAIELLSRARYQAPDQASIYCALGRAYRALGDAAGERTSLHICLEKSPDDALRSEAESRLRQLPQP
jgi:hypothetical protein